MGVAFLLILGGFVKSHGGMFVSYSVGEVRFQTISNPVQTDFKPRFPVSVW
jgi:hypothetical protein